MNRLTAQHIRDLYESQLDRPVSPIGHTDNMQPVLALRHGAIKVVIESTAHKQGLRILYTGEQLEDWLDGDEMQPGEADMIAAEVNAELR